MEIKWARFNNNIWNTKEKVWVDLTKVKVANTPQELVQVGDLVKVLYQHNDKVLPLAIVTDYNNEFIFTNNAVVRINRVVEIWTRTSDDTYTKQWEMKQ